MTQMTIVKQSIPNGNGYMKGGSNERQLKRRWESASNLTAGAF